MSQKQQEKSESIRVVLGGERLYLHPYSVDRLKPPRHSQVFYLAEASQPPYANEDVLGWETTSFGYYVPLWKRFLYAVIGRMFVALWRSFLNRSWFSNEMHRATPFLAESYPGFRFGLQQQWIIEGGWHNFDSVYVVPSQKWLRKQLECRLSSGEYPPQWREDVIAYRKWKLVQEGLDREVRYLVTLDT